MKNAIVVILCICACACIEPSRDTPTAVAASFGGGSTREPFSDVAVPETPDTARLRPISVSVEPIVEQRFADDDFQTVCDPFEDGQCGVYEGIDLGSATLYEAANAGWTWWIYFYGKSTCNNIEQSCTIQPCYLATGYGYMESRPLITCDRDPSHESGYHCHLPTGPAGCRV